MFTKGIIVKVDRTNNIYSVRIPLFESAGDSTQWIVDATACVNPGTYEAYVKDDVVYVAFEDDSMSRPVIVGKLYLGNENVYRSGQKLSSLDVKDNAKLPNDTLLGKITVAEMTKLFRVNSNVKDTLDTLTKNLFDILYYVGKIEYSAVKKDYVKMIKDTFGKTTEWSETSTADGYKYVRTK